MEASDYSKELGIINGELLSVKYDSDSVEDVNAIFKRVTSIRNALKKRVQQLGSYEKEDSDLHDFMECLHEAEISFDFASQLLEGTINELNNSSSLGGGSSNEVFGDSLGVIVLSNYAASGDLHPLADTLTEFLNNIPTTLSTHEVVNEIMLLEGGNADEFQEAIGVKGGILYNFFKKVAELAPKKAQENILQSLSHKWKIFLDTAIPINYDCIGDKVHMNL